MIKIIYNPEIKKFIRGYLVIALISIISSIYMSFKGIDLLKQSIVENNQIMIGTIISRYPELEKDIVGVITQGNNKDNLELGKSTLSKYNYDQNISMNKELSINNNINRYIVYNLIAILIFIIVIMIFTFNKFKYIYENIKDMTKFISSNINQNIYNMKYQNQEGDIGLLKTELKKMTNILNENINLLSQEKIFLNNIISDISHQLKTPMTSMIILNDLMYMDISQNDKIEFLDKIKNQLNRMDWLIKSLLKISKLEAKIIDFKKEDIIVKDIIQASISDLEESIKLKKQEVKIHGNDTDKFVGDKNWTLEAITNIIKNCVEHTKANGMIEVYYTENPIYTEIIIKDNGEGIESLELKNIFKRFYKGKNNNKSDSIGIGLSMSKSIIENQNGSIYAKSELGRGSEFHISFIKY